MFEKLFCDQAEAELISLLRSSRGSELHVTIVRHHKGWRVTTETVNPFRHSYAGTGSSFAEAWTTQGLDPSSLSPRSGK
jgi:hypothetical protein